MHAPCQQRMFVVGNLTPRREARMGAAGRTAGYAGTLSQRDKEFSDVAMCDHRHSLSRKVGQGPDA
jgi:hypothetical protein